MHDEARGYSTKVLRREIFVRLKNIGWIIGGKVTSKKGSVSYDEWVIESFKDDSEAQTQYIQNTIEENRGFPKAILIALRHVAEARGFKSFAEETKLNRESLYKALSEDGNPTLESLSKMLDVLLDISVKPKAKRKVS